MGAQTCHALEFASEELRDDEELVLEAMSFDRSALLYASERLREDKRIWLYNGQPAPEITEPEVEESEDEAAFDAEANPVEVEVKPKGISAPLFVPPHRPSA